jgi:hypothetical protein
MAAVSSCWGSSYGEVKQGFIYKWPAHAGRVLTARFRTCLVSCTMRCFRMTSHSTASGAVNVHLPAICPAQHSCHSTLHASNSAVWRCSCHVLQGATICREFPGSDTMRGNLHVTTKFAAYPCRAYIHDALARTPSVTQSCMLRTCLCREYPGSDKVRGNLHVATKFAAYPWRVTPGNIVAACKGSLRRTGLEQISLGQLHWSAAKYAPLQVSERLSCLVENDMPSLACRCAATIVRMMWAKASRPGAPTITAAKEAKMQGSVCLGCWGNIVAVCKGSLRRTGLEQISLGQLHWSAAKYAPLQVSSSRVCCVSS